MSDDRDRFALPATTRIGGVGLRVRSLDHVGPFYRALGLHIDRNGAFARAHAGGRTLLCLHEDPDAPARRRREAGLFHVAIRVPDRGALADALSRISRNDLRLAGASDHLVSEALYLEDPEGNGVEVYRDRPREEWPRTDDGRIEMDTRPLDLEDLRAAERGGDRVPAETDVGHVHLEVADLARSESFYVGDLGFDVRARYGDDAVFLAAGGYHHHVGLNTWNGRTEPVGGGRGLVWFDVVVPEGGAAELRSRLARRGRDVEDSPGGLLATDPDGIVLRVATR